MNLFAVSGLLTGISSILFGIFILVKNRKSKANYLWAIFATAVAVWGFGGYKIGLVTDSSEALFWWRITYIGIIFIPVFFYHFVYLFLGLEKKKLLYLIYLFGLFFLILEWTPWADLFFGLSNMGLLFSSFYWVFPPTPLFSLFVFSWFGLIIYAHYKLIRRYKEVSGLKRSQIKYFFLATAVGFVGGGISFLPCFGIKLYPISNLTVPLYPAIMTYAILKYRLMDIRMAIGRGVIYFFSFAVIITLSLLLSLFSNHLAIPISSNITFPLVAIIAALVFQPIFLFFEKLASRYLYYTYYSLQQVVQELGKQLNQIIELNKLVILISRFFLSSLKLDRIGIILKEPKAKILEVHESVGFNKRDLFSLLDKDRGFLVKYFQQSRVPIIKEEIPFVIEKLKQAKSVSPLVAKDIIENRMDGLNKLKDDMEKMEIGLFLPLFVEENLIGVIVLGDKTSGESYTAQDINLLTILSAQISVAFNNALLYAEIEKRKADLEKFYKLTVGRELKMIELKKRIKELEEKKGK